MPWVAARKPLHCEPASAPAAVPRQRVKRVFGARRMKSAVNPQHRADRVAITADHQRKRQLDHSPAHKRVTSASSERGSAGRALNRTTRSRPSRSPWLFRNHSRNSRRTLFRSTARDSKRLGTIRPSRANFIPFGRDCIETARSRLGLVEASTPEKSRPPRRCARLNRLVPVKQQAALCPWPGAHGSPPGLREYAYGQENHGCACAERQRVERCVSYR